MREVHLHPSTTPLIRVFHNSPTTHHNPPQLTITRHNSPQVPEVQVVVPQLTTPHLASFPLYHNLQQLATTHLPSVCLYNNLPQLTTICHNSSQLFTSKTHHNSPQLTTVCAGHDSKCEKQFSFKHISIWLSGLRGQALAEVVSGSKPGFVAFHFSRLVLCSRF